MLIKLNLNKIQYIVIIDFFIHILRKVNQIHEKLFINTLH